MPFTLFDGDEPAMINIVGEPTLEEVMNDQDGIAEDDFSSRLREEDEINRQMQEDYIIACGMEDYGLLEDKHAKPFEGAVGALIARYGLDRGAMDANSGHLQVVVSKAATGAPLSTMATGLVWACLSDMGYLEISCHLQIGISVPGMKTKFTTISGKWHNAATGGWWAMKYEGKK